MKQQFYIYILASCRNGTLYIGSTSDLVKRVYEHKNKLIGGFTKKYNITILVHYEITDLRVSAVHREKQLKKWKRNWKLRLIEDNNPKWEDLYLKL